MARRIPREHEEAIVAAYLAGATMNEAAALFGYSGKACLNALKRHGITPRGHTEVCRTPQEHEDAIINTYLSGASTREAAALFGYNAQTCTNILRRRGITPRSREEVCRYYAVDELFFDRIDTEAKAYWLGFITADGGIVRHQLIIQLKISDMDHLHKFAASLHSEQPVSIREVKGYKVQPIARITISSVSLIRALNKLGLTEKKSFTIHPCEYVPDWLLSAYWRGIFDGDGSICKVGALKRVWEVSLVGNQAIVNGFRDFVGRFIESNTRVKPLKNIYQIKYHGLALPRAVAQILYSEATIYLDRKYALARQLCGDLL